MTNETRKIIDLTGINDTATTIVGAVITTGSASKTVIKRKPARKYRYTYRFLENEIMELPYRKRLTLAWYIVMRRKVRK